MEADRRLAEPPVWESRGESSAKPCETNASRTARQTSAGLPHSGRSAANFLSNPGRFSRAPGIHPGAGGEIGDRFDKPLGISIEGQDLGDFAQIFVGELVGTRGAIPRPEGRLGRGAACRPEDQDRSMPCRCRSRQCLSIEPVNSQPTPSRRANWNSAGRRVINVDTAAGCTAVPPCIQTGSAGSVGRIEIQTGTRRGGWRYVHVHR